MAQAAQLFMEITGREMEMIESPAAEGTASKAHSEPRVDGIWARFVESYRYARAATAGNWA